MTTLWHDERVAGNPAYWRGRSHMSQPFVSERQRQMWGFVSGSRVRLTTGFPAMDVRFRSVCLLWQLVSGQVSGQASTWYQQ